MNPFDNEKVVIFRGIEKSGKRIPLLGVDGQPMSEAILFGNEEFGISGKVIEYHTEGGVIVVDRFELWGITVTPRPLAESR